jgi:hypothetical protein
MRSFYPPERGTMIEQDVEIDAKNEVLANQRIRQTGWILIGILVIFLLGLGSGYLRWGQQDAGELDLAVLQEQINSVDGYALSVSYADLGPRLLEGGVIDYEAFAGIYENSGNPLSAEQVDILTRGSEAEIVITAQNAHFLLNFFWAVGLANNNPVLTAGPMVTYGEEGVGQFASTGGWSLATKPVNELYSSLNLIPLTAAQQQRVQEVAAGVYRPCCDNNTLFPDCNHGMAMLGILELMASGGASVDEMFEAAKYINAYWFPQQTLETAIYLQVNQNVDFKNADAKLVVSETFSSGSGASMVHEDLKAKGLLKQSPGQGGSCAN